MNKHLPSSKEVGAKWVKDVQAKYGKAGKVKFACVGFW